MATSDDVGTVFSTPEELYNDDEKSKCVFCKCVVAATRQHMQKVHLKYSVCFRDGEVDRFCIPCFCEKKLGQRSHWHCPKCKSILQRKHSFEIHLKSHGLILLENKLLKEITSTEKENPIKASVKKSEIKAFQCPSCSACFSKSATLRKHESEKHEKVSEPILLVDEEKGIFVTAKDKSGPRSIIHICKSFSKQTLDCEVAGCREFMTMATGRECMHLERVKYFKPQQPPPLLQTSSVQEMYEKGMISSSTKEECICLNDNATQDGTACVYPVFFEEHGYSGLKANFSVFTAKADSWCIFGRTRVTLDTDSGKWTCRCKGTKKRMCVHIYVSMCWTFQEKQHLLRESDKGRDCTSDSDDLSGEDMEPGYFKREDHISSVHIKKMVEYMCKSKRIPPKLPEELQKTAPSTPLKFSPEETRCPYCPGPSPPDLSEEKIVTKKGIIYGILTVHKDVHVYIKTCPVCRSPVRCQDYLTGFHNYNNRVFLTLQLCSFMTNLLKSHTAIGRFITAMEHQLDISIHHNTIRRAFFHYSALTAYSYDFFCYRCGHHPPVIISDANWKLSFDVPVSLMKRPNAKDVKDEELSVDITAKWDRLEKEIIATGICEDLKTHNPYSEELSHSSFVPWIGQGSRICDVIPKTEILKGLANRPTAESKPRRGPCMNEEELISLMESKKASRSELIKACSDLGVSTEGSETDLINRLEEMLLYKDVYPKMYAKLQRTGGGVMHMGCTHSVIYYCSPLLWQESARDHADGLLSFSHPPNVYISDVAGRVARHTNNRTQQKYFHPHNGRLCESSQENIQAAKNNTLKVHLPWTKHLLFGKKKDVQNNENQDRFQRPHPITGSSERYSLYDRFHQKNQTRPEEILRSLNIVPDLCSNINSSEAEQKNRELSYDRYFLCQMKEKHFLFSLRLVFHLHNDLINQKFMQNLEKQTAEELGIGSDGRVKLMSTVEMMPGPTENLTAEMPRECTEELVTGEGFSMQQFEIQKEHKEKLAVLYKTTAANHAIVKVDQALVSLADLESVCPKALLHDEPDISFPWLTDDLVNARILQLARPVQNMFALQTYHFTVWWRNWLNAESINSRHLTCIQGINQDSTVLFPRVVGHQTPETGNHFILWILDGSKGEIRIYDSLKEHIAISGQDMDILCQAFKDTWGLKEWSVSYPNQWRQKDGVNCGVFVCTSAELDIRGIKMTNEALNQIQLSHLRLYHAACLVADAVPTGAKVRDSCMAESIHACNYFDTSGKGQRRRLYPQVQKEDWIKCETCNGWLHKDCANYEPSKTDIFTCGCGLPEPYSFSSTLTCLKHKGVKGLISKNRIVALKEMLESGERKSNRMFLWQNPGRNLTLKQILNTKPSVFSEKPFDELINLLKSSLDLDLTILHNVDFIIDVMMPEATIDILMRMEGFPRIQAERLLGKAID